MQITFKSDTSNLARWGASDRLIGHQEHWHAMVAPRQQHDGALVSACKILCNPCNNPYNCSTVYPNNPIGLVATSASGPRNAFCADAACHASVNRLGADIYYCALMQYCMPQVAPYQVPHRYLCAYRAACSGRQARRAHNTTCLCQHHNPSSRSCLCASSITAPPHAPQQQAAGAAAERVPFVQLPAAEAPSSRA